MTGDSSFLKIFRGVRDKARALGAKALAQEITVYPSYGYLDPVAKDRWLVPMRVWVHDNRDTPFVEQMLDHWAIRHFEKAIERPLEVEEKAHLRACLENFIADDKSNESVTFTFTDDPEQTLFNFERATSANGIIEETVRIPASLVARCYAHQPDGPCWLQIIARTGDGHGMGVGAVRFLKAEGLSVISDIDDTVKVTHVPAGKKTVLRSTFLEKFRAAEGMRERYVALAAGAGTSADVCCHYVSGSPWQLYAPIARFLFEETQFPAGTVHMKNLRKNLLEAGALETILSFALGGDIATLEQKVRQITNLIIHLPRRKFILIGDSGEKDPEVYRAIGNLFPDQIEKIFIRDVLGERLAGMELITGPDVPVALDMSELMAEMESLIARARAAAPGSPKL
jgi:hypothetical protein